MKVIEATVTDLVAFARCEHKASLLHRAKPKAAPATPREKGVVTHAILERKNTHGSAR